MTDADLDDIETTHRAANIIDTNHARTTRRKMFDELIAEVRRLRADNAVLSESVDVYMKTSMATNEQLNVALAERDELRACLNDLAATVGTYLHGCKYGGADDDALREAYQRCRRAMGDGDGT